VLTIKGAEIFSLAMHIMQDGPNSKSQIHFSAVIAKNKNLTSGQKHTLNPGCRIQFRELWKWKLWIWLKKQQICHNWHWKWIFERGSLHPKVCPSGWVNAKGRVSDIR